MPSGRTHDQITLWSLPLVAVLSLWATRHSSISLGICSGFLLGGLMLGPDLDIHSVQYKRWGWFRWIWLPYRGSMRHRSPFSHGPITGTLVRVIYLMAWLGFAILAAIALVNELGQLGWTWGDIAQVFQNLVHRYNREILAIGLGLELGAFSHYTADWIVSSYKRSRRPTATANPTRSKQRSRKTELKK